VSPDDIYASYGADTLRLYELSTGPLDTDRPWRTDGIAGAHRFLQRLWRGVIAESTGEVRVSEQTLTPRLPGWASSSGMLAWPGRCRGRWRWPNPSC